MSEPTLEVFYKDPLISVNETASMQTVMELMKQNRIGHILVLDDDNNLSGIISRNDVYEKLHYVSTHTSGVQYSKQTLEHMSAKDIMTAKPVCLQSYEPMDKAIQILLEEKFHAIPILEGNEVKGIVTALDLLDFFHD